MAVAKKYNYRIQYIDNTYQIVDWTKAELKSVSIAMANEVPAILVGEDVFRTTDIRAIVYLPPVPVPTEAEIKAEQEKQAKEEWDFVDAQTKKWLKEQGILPTTGGANE